MADKPRSDLDAARIKRGTLSVKTKRKQPFVLESFLSHAGGGRTKAKYRKDETIFGQGDPADAVFYIMDGKCKVTVFSEKGKEAVVALHEKGDFFGEGCLNGHRRRLATVTAITESEIMRLDKATMARALHNEPNFSELFISHLLARNARVEIGPGRSVVQFEREAPGEAASIDGKFWQGGKAKTCNSESEPGDSRRDDRHDEVAGELFHEQIQEIGLHRLQRRRLRSPYLVIAHGFA